MTNTTQSTPIDSLKDAPEGGHMLAPSTDPELERGLVLDGSYRICETVGRSGMATIYRAEEVAGEGRTVAIKVPLMKVESDPVCFARFRNEEEVGARFNHPYLVKIHAPTGRRSRPYIVMEYLRGCTLGHLMDRMRPLPEADALRIASMICEALGEMHRQGVVHRDLKPSNIMVCKDGSFRIFDFGLASAPLRRRSWFAKLTPTFGTPEYMAPEQVKNTAIDERSDIYGVGAILYEMLTGEVPFRRDEPWESAFARLNGDPVAPRKINPSISPEAEEIVLRALQRRPSDRYASVEAMKSDLDFPSAVRVTGLCESLREPRAGVSFQGTPILAGTLLGVGTLLGLLALFVLLRVFLIR